MKKIMAFFQKHLIDPFYLEGTQRISLRYKIFREIAANILIHREYFNAFPAKVIIENERVYSENGNKPHGHGLIDTSSFSPYPKNPTIARIFKEIGYAEELGSGIKNISKYIKEYQNGEVQFIEEDVFKVIISLREHVPPHVEQDKTSTILQFCIEPKTRDEIQTFLGLSDRKYFSTKLLNPLISEGLLQLTIPDKPRVISLSEDSKEYLALPRGCEEKLLIFFQNQNINIIDERNSGVRINAIFNGLLRAEQEEVVNALLRYENGVISATTAFGKTVIAANIIANRKINTLIIVHTTQLLEQWKKRLEEFLILDNTPIELTVKTNKMKNIGQFSGGKNKLSGIIDIATMQSISRNGEVKDFIKNYGYGVLAP